MFEKIKRALAPQILRLSSFLLRGSIMGPDAKDRIWRFAQRYARLRTHNQNITVAARAMADRNTFGHRSYRVATRLQSFKRPNMISIRFRRLYLRLSYLMILSRDFRPGMQGVIPIFTRSSRNQSASYPRSPSNQSAAGRLLTRARAPV